MSGGEGITVDVILPMEKAGSERVRRAAVARKLGISPSRIKDVRLVKESIDSRQKKILFQLRLLVGVDSPLPPEHVARIASGSSAAGEGEYPDYFLV